MTLLHFYPLSRAFNLSLPRGPVVLKWSLSARRESSAADAFEQRCPQEKEDSAATQEWKMDFSGSDATSHCECNNWQLSQSRIKPKYILVSTCLQECNIGQRPLCPGLDPDPSLHKHLQALPEYSYLSGLSVTISKHKWDKTAAAMNTNINYKIMLSKCMKHEFQVFPQSIHIAGLWQRLPTSWQEGAGSPAMLSLRFSFIKEKDK